MAYLSKIALNPLMRGGQRLIDNPQALHAAVLSSMPPTVSGRTLWRDEVRTLPNGAKACEVLVLTPVEPDWRAIIEQGGWRGPEGAPLVRSMQPLLDLVATGREFTFRVRANPVTATRSVEHPTAGQRAKLDSAGRARGVLVAARTVAHQQDWFTDRVASGRWGFQVVAADEGGVGIAAREHRRFSKRADGGRRDVTLDRVTYAGTLRVTDPDRLREVLLEGVGRAKAYGCGLLTLAPVGGSGVVAG